MIQYYFLKYFSMFLVLRYKLFVRGKIFLRKIFNSYFADIYRHKKLGKKLIKEEFPFPRRPSQSRFNKEWRKVFLQIIF